MPHNDSLAVFLLDMSEFALQPLQLISRVIPSFHHPKVCDTTCHRVDADNFSVSGQSPKIFNYEICRVISKFAVLLGGLSPNQICPVVSVRIQTFNLIGMRIILKVSRVSIVSALKRIDADASLSKCALDYLS